MRAMTDGTFHFGPFRLDTAERLLIRDGRTIELNARYFDALALMVGDAGQLVTKDRFNEAVWRGVPVTDEALTQCIRTLRQALGDKAAAPRYIETVPKHGYRFIAEVAEPRLPGPFDAADEQRSGWKLALAGAIGGGTAGALGGLAYGSIAASRLSTPQGGAFSALLVLMALSALVGLAGGLGVGIGLGIAQKNSDEPGWALILGGALGGLLVGALVRLIGLDAFALLLGRSPGNITGASEGLVLGATTGAALWFALARAGSGRRLAVASAALAGAVAGAAISLVGGRLMAGSLALLARRFPDSRLDLDALAPYFGEARFGAISEAVTAALEGALFVACIVAAALVLRARR